MFDYAESCARFYELLASGREGFGLEGVRFEGNELILDYTAGIRYSVELMEADGPEYVGEQRAEDTGTLGTYRLMIHLCDTALSNAFAEKYSNFEAYDLDDTGLRIKITPTADHGYILYIGSDKPFDVMEQEMTAPLLAMGSITIPIY